MPSASTIARDSALLASSSKLSIGINTGGMSRKSIGSAISVTVAVPSLSRARVSRLVGSAGADNVLVSASGILRSSISLNGAVRGHPVVKADSPGVVPRDSGLSRLARIAPLPVQGWVHCVRHRLQIEVGVEEFGNPFSDGERIGNGLFVWHHRD